MNHGRSYTISALFFLSFNSRLRTIYTNPVWHFQYELVPCLTIKNYFVNIRRQKNRKWHDFTLHAPRILVLETLLLFNATIKFICLFELEIPLGRFIIMIRFNIVKFINDVVIEHFFYSTVTIELKQKCIQNKWNVNKKRIHIYFTF